MLYNVSRAPSGADAEFTVTDLRAFVDSADKLGLPDDTIVNCLAWDRSEIVGKIVKLSTDALATPPSRPGQGTEVDEA